MSRRVSEPIVVVGASLAGFRAAETLRHQGYDGELVVVGAEVHRPYERPPLSKQVLAEAGEPAGLTLIGAADDALGITWRLGTAATAVDPVARRITLADGSVLAYRGLVLATGARPRTLPGAGGLTGVFTLRTVDDALALRRAIAGASAVAVIGAGFLGAEVAATARSGGAAVTLVEPLEAPLARVLPAPIGQVVARLHREHGVDVRLGVGVEAVEGAGRAERLALSDGSTVVADVVVAAVGVVPNVDWLASSGLPLANGVVCDAACQVAPAVVAAGDVAAWASRRYGATLRIEHYDHAAAMGAHAARTLLHGASTGQEPPEPFDPVPWFWTDQYDHKVQLAGRVAADDAMEVVDGALTDRRFTVVFGRAGRVTGVLGVNRPAAVMRWRNRLLQGVAWADALAGR